MVICMWTCHYDLCSIVEACPTSLYDISFDTSKHNTNRLVTTDIACAYVQVARIAAALAMAPVLDGVCLRAQQKLGLASKRTALSLLVVSCIALASLCFGATMLVWA